ncbi:MAG: T9SS type A sorting domain-containing protein [Ignavibacteria bacterium]|nr:T9SS type A sorting domain-containing protein [Ignavibacteria bacterium]
MKSVLSALYFTLFLISVNAQINIQKIFDKKYSELPFPLRIENSGIYSIASFDINNDNIAFKTYDESNAYLFESSKNRFCKIESQLAYDVVLTEKNISSKIVIDEENISSSTQVKKVFADETAIITIDQNGELKSNNVIIASVKVTPDMLSLFSNYLSGETKTLYFPKTLAYASIIGIDKHSNHFILIEEFESHLPLKVKRAIITLDYKGEIISQLNIPMVKYLSLLKEFQIDADGNLFHLFTLQDKVSILKISGLTTSKVRNLNYPTEFQYDVHFNYFVKTDEYSGDSPQNTELASSRLTAVRMGESYVLHKYRTTSNNLAPVNVTGPDGDIVRTPSWLITGINAKIPYKWGGFQTLVQFDAGLIAGKYAGDIHTSGVSSHAVGVDCSGFVSRCWQLSYQSSTSMMPDITTLYSDWNLIKPGDAIHKVGHVRLFLERNVNGSFRVVESSARDWGVSYWSYTASDLATYTARYYNNMESDFSLNRPVLQRAEIINDSDIKLHWTIDTINVVSIKIYSSKNEKDWTFLKAESPSLTSTIVTQNNDHYSYRISTVINNSSQSEGNWSNVLSVRNNGNSGKILIVDGFERDNGSGSWQGPGHTFVSKYAVPINSLNKSFESLKNNVLTDTSISLNNYGAIYWILGDESTEHETFNSDEQILVMNYLENGGHLFVSGSEIGWDLSYRGSAEDKAFYNNYLKANYISDGAGVLNATGVTGSIFDGLSVRFGQTYEEDYPDEINPLNGSSLCFNYSNNKGAGILYSGSFGNSSQVGKLIHFAFPVETIADDSIFSSLISKSSNFFDGTTGIESEKLLPTQFQLSQNYPNPFNPSTVISYQLPAFSHVVLKVYDLLGNEIVTLVNEEKAAGKYSIVFNSDGLASGLYFYTLKSGSFSSTKKMIFIK